MGAFAKLSVVATATAVMLSSCGGGGNASPQPSITSQTAPSATNRTPVGTAQLTLAFPKVVTAKNATSASRSPKYVNPVGSAGGPCPNENLLDIYVDGTLQPTLDGGLEGASHSLCVAATSDGTQTATLPLYLSQGNQIVAVEWNPTVTHVLAIGETDQGTFTAGTVVPISLTMLMNAISVGITTLSFSDIQIMGGQPYGALHFSCPGPAAQFGVYTADWTGTFVPTAGSGGTSTATATGTPLAGTSSMAQTAIPGVYNIAWDGGCNDVTVLANAANPAYVIYNDVFNQNNGVYPGMRILYPTFAAWFPQLNHSTVSGTVVVHNSTN